MGKQESNFFVYDCGTHYSNGHLVIIHNKICTVFEFKTGILCNNIFARSSKIVFFHTFRSAQSNMNGRMR